MDDLISRQAAIEDIRTMVPKDARFDIKWIEMWLMQLPSAQPEIIRCRDCIWWTKQKASLQGRCDLMRMYPTGAWFCGNAERKEDHE